MELLLNLVWLLLALPAYCLWRNSRDSRKSGSPSPFQCLLALGCALVLLFPVVSATDDLHAMRAEMEESSKRSIRQAGGEKSSVGDSRWHNPPAAVAAFATLAPLCKTWRLFHVPQLFFAVAASAVHSGRAPPVAVSSSLQS
ncbi:MAG TPA: hypothetical protein VIH89_18545 [Candidatus Sulfotelmatobacter sp.]|jgi:hypothetical protein